MPLKNDGIDPSKVKDDPLFWISEQGKGKSYAPFTEKEWDELNAGKAKL